MSLSPESPPSPLPRFLLPVRLTRVSRRMCPSFSLWPDRVFAASAQDHYLLAGTATGRQRRRGGRRLVASAEAGLRVNDQPDPIRSASNRSAGPRTRLSA